MNSDTIQTLIYRKLSIAGHLTIFVTRTRVLFWSQRPAPVLFGAAVVTQLIATLIALSGIFMAPLDWKLVLVVWGCALAGFLVEDRIKLASYRIFHTEAPALLARKRPEAA